MKPVMWFFSHADNYAIWSLTLFSSMMMFIGVGGDKDWKSEKKILRNQVSETLLKGVISRASFQKGLLGGSGSEVGDR